MVQVRSCVCIALAMLTLCCCTSQSSPALPLPVQIIALLLLNATISFVEESNADKAIKALAGALAPKCKVGVAARTEA